MSYRIQHRETGCWLLVEGFGRQERDAWLGPKDGPHATKFDTADEAKAVARKFSLTSKNYRITNEN